jgi:tetratricopeptide (TPR) repeat protein
VNKADDCPPVTQIVTATAGFAYGVIGADLHVFGDGTPLYILQNWSGPPPEDRQWLRELPSRMLNARFAIVDFTGRRDELAQLHRWREGRPRLAVRWLYAPGGQGKTRLADQFARESAEQNWKVVTASHGLGTIIRAASSQDIRLGGSAGLLLIVDYTDRWPLTHLTWLLSNAILCQAGVKTRVLMLGRALDMWPSVCAVLANQQAETSDQFLEPLPEDSSQRSEMFAAARESFAKRYEVSDPRAIPLPESLEHPALGLTLAVHMAALVAVDAYTSGRRPSNAAGFTSYLLDRERSYWARMYENRTKGLDYQTPPSVMGRVVFTAILTGSLQYAKGKAVLDRLDIEVPSGRILKDHDVCYPPADPAIGTVLEPLNPDLLAEDFLALSLLGHTNPDARAQPWAPYTLTELMSRDPQDRTSPPWTARVIAFLTAATERWPHLGSAYLYPLLVRDPRLAIDAGGAALSALATLPDLDLAVLEAIEPYLPVYEHADLDIGAAEVIVRLTEHRLAATADLTERARLNSVLSYRLINAGRYQDAGRTSAESVALYRRLTQTDHDAHKADLAFSLDILSESLAWEGKLDDAVQAIADAVTIYNQLARDDPKAYEPSFARSLGHFGVRLAAAGKMDGAVKALGGAATIQMRLGEIAGTEDAMNSKDAVDLADTFYSIAGVFMNAGRKEDSRVAAGFAIDMYRQLSKQWPQRFEPRLAQSLRILAQGLQEPKAWNEVLIRAREAVDILRRLAQGNPAVYEPDLADSLGLMAAGLWNTAEPENSFIANREAISILRPLAQNIPSEYEPKLAASLTNLAFHVSSQPTEEALSAGREAADIYLRLVQHNPREYEPQLADVLEFLRLGWSILERNDDLIALTSAATEIYSWLVQNGLKEYMPKFAEWETRFGSALQDGGQSELAATVFSAAIETYYSLAKNVSRIYYLKLVQSLKGLEDGVLSATPGERVLMAFQRAVNILRLAVIDQPDLFVPSLANVLTGMGTLLASLERLQESATILEEAVSIYSSLAKAKPTEFQSLLIETSGYYVAVLKTLKNSKDA